MVLQVIDVDELSKERIGYLAISLNGWTDATLPTLTAGSCAEIAGSLYYATGDENLGTAGEIAAIGANTIVYSYYNVSTDLFYFSSSAPAWDDAKSGWYHTVSTTHRCFISFLKIAAGNYIRKNILDSRRAMYRKNYAYETDEYTYSTNADFNAFNFNTTIPAVAGTTIRTTKYINVKKSITCYLKTTRVSGTTWSDGLAMYIAQDNAYRLFAGKTSFASGSYMIVMNPAKYKLVGRGVCVNPGPAGQGVRKHSIYISGVYGLSSKNANGIIDT